jgi:hypothetical protein
MAQKRFNPRRLTLSDCRVRIESALKKLKFDPDRQIFTSRDKNAIKLQSMLQTRNVPDAFTKWQLPIWFRETMLFISVAPPNVRVPAHSHDGEGLRFIAGGSITYKSQELTAGDWMYIPRDKTYGFQVGPLGAHMFYCYHC